jgi:hypothetical protein
VIIAKLPAGKCSFFFLPNLMCKCSIKEKIIKKCRTSSSKRRRVALTDIGSSQVIGKRMHGIKQAYKQLTNVD